MSAEENKNIAPVDEDDFESLLDDCSKGLDTKLNVPSTTTT